MERIIKFRAWDKLGNKMYEDTKHSMSADTELGLNEIIARTQKCDYELMQFTGLVDKNGNEIYEGDIVKYEYTDEPGVVEYGHTTCECCGWCYGWSTKNEDVRFDNPKNCEVLGNVYENPELLTTT